MDNEMLTGVWGGISDSGHYSTAFIFSGDAGNYRVRLFFRYDGVNDLSSGTSVGLYAVSDNPCDLIMYDDWGGYYRKPYTDISGSTCDSSYNIEVDCEFSGDTQEHLLEFFDNAGRPVNLRGESVINGSYDATNLPVNILLERRLSQVSIRSAKYSPETKRVNIITDGAHGFSEGDAVSISGFPRGEHSCGVDGERYNGTYSVHVESDTEFSYVSHFYGGFPGQRRSYADLPGAYASKWVVSEYSAKYQAMPSPCEALIMWPAHTFKQGDRVTLMSGDTVIARDAVISETAPNSFVCRSLDIPANAEIGSIVYAPRTPVAGIPANYSVEVKHAGNRKSRGSVVPSSLVNNASRTINSGSSFTPFAVGSFDLDNAYAGGQPRNGKIVVGSRKFGAFSFFPGNAITDSSEVQYKFSFVVPKSTEVATHICLSQINGVGWDNGTDANTVYAKMSRVPLARAEISTNALHDGDYSCAFGEDTKFTLIVGGDTAKRWNAAGNAISLAITLDGRPGAEILIDTEISIELSGLPAPSQDPIAIAVRPDLITVGDTVTVYARYYGTFIGNAERLRISIGGEPDPDKMVRLISSDSESLRFIMPEGYTGRHTITVMEKPQSGDEWIAVSDSSQVDIVERAYRVVKLNDYIRPGEVERKVSRSASYNRDFGYVGFTEITDENSMIQNLYSCLLTRKGERLFNTDFGTTIEERIFSIRDGGSSNAILKECFDVIEEYEPRIQLVYEQCSVRDMGPHGIYLVLGVIVPGGNVEMVNIPFKNRGRMV